ncbi:MAG: TrbC/VirB2 family protein [Bdellovibrionales bacterium]|nr:TrbC/VirB2 family protein [Bdellovibrionales bacterium]
MKQKFLEHKKTSHRKQNFYRETVEWDRILLTVYVCFFLCLPCYSMARDFLSSVESASDQIRQIIAVVGVLALMVAGVCFYWSKRLGMEKLSAAIIGTVVFAAASTIFTLFYKAFN